MKRIRECRLWRNREGATAIEYALIVALVVVAASASFPSMSAWVNTVITATADSLNGSS